MRRRPDEVDLWGMAWARQRRLMLGIIEGNKLEPRERLGKLRCTLGAVLKEGAGAGQGGVAAQNFPEVYTGLALVVHRVYMRMPGGFRQAMQLHYVWREIPARLKAREAGVSESTYWKRVAAMKMHLYQEVIVPDADR